MLDAARRTQSVLPPLPGHKRGQFGREDGICLGLGRGWPLPSAPALGGPGSLPSHPSGALCPGHLTDPPCTGSWGSSLLGDPVNHCPISHHCLGALALPDSVSPNFQATARHPGLCTVAGYPPCPTDCSQRNLLVGYDQAPFRHRDISLSGQGRPSTTVIANNL